MSRVVVRSDIKDSVKELTVDILPGERVLEAYIGKADEGPPGNLANWWGWKMTVVVQEAEPPPPPPPSGSRPPAPPRPKLAPEIPTTGDKPGWFDRLVGWIHNGSVWGG